MRKTPFAGIELTSQRVRRLRGANWATGVDRPWWSHIIAEYVWINRVRLPILLVVSWTGKINIALSSCVPENLASRDGFSRPVPRQPVHLQTQSGWNWLVLTYGIPPEFRGGVHLWNRHTPSGQSRVFIGPRNCVPMAFTAESLPAQGQ